MELFENSRIAIATIADYLDDPESYDAEASWNTALHDVAGDADAEAYGLFADNVRSSCLSSQDAPILTRALDEFSFGCEYGDRARAVADLSALADKMRAAADHLLRGPVTNAALVAEARPWLESFETGANAVACVATLAADNRLASDAASELAPFQIRLRQAGRRVFGDTLDMTLADLIAASSASAIPTQPS